VLPAASILEMLHVLRFEGGFDSGQGDGGGLLAKGSRDVECSVGFCVTVIVLPVVFVIVLAGGVGWYPQTFALLPWHFSRATGSRTMSSLTTCVTRCLERASRATVRMDRVVPRSLSHFTTALLLWPVQLTRV
jgi:hypothetical protein